MSDPIKTTAATACIQLERSEDGVWEFAVWHAGEQLVLGHRPTQNEAYEAACQKLKEVARHD